MDTSRLSAETRGAVRLIFLTAVSNRGAVEA
jgi:hypothetical protein